MTMKTWAQSSNPDLYHLAYFNTTLATLAFLEDTDVAEDLHDHESHSLAILWKCTMVLRIAICSIGIVFNAFNHCTFIRIGLKDSVTILFFNIAVADFCYLLLALVYGITELCSYLDVVTLNLKLYKQVQSVQLIAQIHKPVYVDVSSYLTCVLAVQRCLCVVKPLQFKNMFTKARTLIAVGTVWLLCFSCGLAVLSSVGKREVILDDEEESTSFELFMKPVYDKIFNVLNVGCLVIINSCCQVLVFVSVVTMANALRRSLHFRRVTSTTCQGKVNAGAPSDPTQADDESGATSSSSKAVLGHNSKERQVIIQVSLVSFIFFLTHVHFAVFCVVTYVSPGLYTFAAEIYSRECYLLYICNASVNFLIYCKYNSRFRQLWFGTSPRKE